MSSLVEDARKEQKDETTAWATEKGGNLQQTPSLSMKLIDPLEFQGPIQFGTSSIARAARTKLYAVVTMLLFSPEDLRKKHTESRLLAPPRRTKQAVQVNQRWTALWVVLQSLAVSSPRDMFAQIY